MANKSQRLPSEGFQRLIKTGKRVSGKWLILNYLKNNQKDSRIGWTISGHIANSVTRNKLKRWGREFFKKEKFEEGFDINIVFKRRDKDFYKKLKHEEFLRELQQIVNKI